MRTLLLMILAAVIGAIAAAQITGALRQRSAYQRAVMDMMAHHAGALDHSLRAQRCAATTTANDFAVLGTVSGDIPQAFPEMMSDQHFAQLANGARTTIGVVGGTPPVECVGLRKAIARIGERCDACHREYR
ncbi:MAG: hypothetical protein ABIY40_05500 [Rhodanobacteraceae bacterium]|nr:hypothetical protein [Pseudomonadota bacterium]